MVAIGNAVDSYVTFKILTILATDWQQLPAFKLGIVDKNGKPLKKSWELKTTAEKNAYTPLHILVFNLKRLLNKVPGTARKLGTVAAAAWLLREHAQLSDNDFTLICEQLQEEGEIANTSGGGNIAGLDDNPPVRVKPDDKFAGDGVFKVSPNTYNHASWPKRKWERWSKFLPLEEDADGDTDTRRVVQYAIQNPNKPIIIQDSCTGAMKYIKYGKKK